MKKLKLGYGLIAIAVAIVVFTQISIASHGADAATDVAVAATAPVADSHGNLHVPENYRALYQYLGSWAVANDKGPGSKQLHIVYSSPGTMAAYRKTGRFADGSVLVKEVFNAETGHYTTGTASHPQKLVGWFVMVKDSKNSHPGNKLWGDGWGWSWFDSDKPSKTTSTNYKVDCQACHVPARNTDWVYVKGYPQLQH